MGLDTLHMIFEILFVFRRGQQGGAQGRDAAQPERAAADHPRVSAAPSADEPQRLQLGVRERVREPAPGAELPARAGGPQRRLMTVDAGDAAVPPGRRAAGPGRVRRAAQEAAARGRGAAADHAPLVTLCSGSSARVASDLESDKERELWAKSMEKFGDEMNKCEKFILFSEQKQNHSE